LFYTGDQVKINDEEIEAVLLRIIDAPALHVKWLNTLSFLEHVGSRKILKTQSHPRIDEHILRHAAEEARHAYQFKKMITSIASNIQIDYAFKHMLCGYHAYRYFQNLDSLVKKGVQKDSSYSLNCYYYVTTLIEERAGWLYPIYQKCLQLKKSPINLAPIIFEEERHLKEMYAGLEKMDAGILETFRENESVFFDKFFHMLRESIYSEERRIS